MRIEEKKNPVETVVILSIEDRIRLNEVFEYFKEIERESRENIKTLSTTDPEVKDAFKFIKNLTKLNTFVGKLVYTPEKSNVFCKEEPKVNTEEDKYGSLPKIDSYDLWLLKAGTPTINTAKLLKELCKFENLIEIRKIMETTPKIIWSGAIKPAKEILNEFRIYTNAELVITKHGEIPSEGFCKE